MYTLGELELARNDAGHLLDAASHRRPVHARLHLGRQTGLRVSQNFTQDFQLAFGAETSYTSVPGGTATGLAFNGTTAPIPGTGFPGAYTYHADRRLALQ